MDEVDGEDRTLNCPRCGGTLQGREERYAYIYTCCVCGVQVFDYKVKVADCITLVLKVLHVIRNYISYFAKTYGCVVSDFYLYKSRARGDCGKDSDVDIWIEVPSLTDIEELNKKLLEEAVPWYYLGERRVVWDFKFGVGTPPGTHYDSQTLMKLRAMLLSS